MPARIRRSALCAVVLLASSALAGPVDPLLPSDTEAVVTINVRQLLDSELLKKFGLNPARELLKNSGHVKEVLDELGFDPLTDLERITVAGPGGKSQDRGLVILRGKFDTAKFKARGEQAARDNGEVLKKIHMVPDGIGGQQAVYEVALPEGEVSTLFLANPSKDLLLVAAGKDYVADALKKAPGKAAVAFKNKDVASLLEKLDEKQTLSVAAVGSALAQGDVPDAAREILAKLDAVGGGVRVTDEVKLEIALTIKTVDQAKEMEKTVSEGLNQALGLLAILGGQQPELTPVIDFVKSLRTSRKERTILLRGNVPADVFEKLRDK